MLSNGACVCCTYILSWSACGTIFPSNYALNIILICSLLNQTRRDLLCSRTISVNIRLGENTVCIIYFLWLLFAWTVSQITNMLNTGNKKEYAQFCIFTARLNTKRLTLVQTPWHTGSELVRLQHASRSARAGRKTSAIINGLQICVTRFSDVEKDHDYRNESGELHRLCS